MVEEKYDFFISHASEDKESFVRPLAEELVKKGYTIWYDEMSLEVGDSLVQRISEGVKNSLYGIIVLSENFFKKKWTKKEFEALVNKEIITDDNLILPVWLNLSAKEVFNFSPLLSDKVAISVTENEVNKVITGIEKKIKFAPVTIDQIRSIIDYIINCNDDRREKYFLDIEHRIKSIFLYQKEYYNWYVSDETFNETNPWNDILVEQKGKEFEKEYEIPPGVWLNPEPFPWSEVERAIKLCSKWILRKLTFKEAHELYFLLEEILDTDLHYILYGLPHASVRKNMKVYDASVDGIFEVGIKNVKKRKPSKNLYDQSLKEIFDKYYR
jgi:hypothetical protein